MLVSSVPAVLILLLLAHADAWFYNHFKPFAKSEVEANIENAKNFSAGAKMLPMNVSEDFTFLSGYYYQIPEHRNNFLLLNSPSRPLEEVTFHEWRTSHGVPGWNGTATATKYVNWYYREFSFNPAVPSKVFTPGWKSVWRDKEVFMASRSCCLVDMGMSLEFQCLIEFQLILDNERLTMPWELFYFPNLERLRPFPEISFTLRGVQRIRGKPPFNGDLFLGKSFEYEMTGKSTFEGLRGWAEVVDEVQRGVKVTQFKIFFA